MFVGCFRGRSLIFFGMFVGCFCGRSLGNSWLNVDILQSVRHIIPIR